MLSASSKQCDYISGHTGQFAYKILPRKKLDSRDGEPPLGLIVIDYLQLMSSSEKFESRNLEIGAI